MWPAAAAAYLLFWWWLYPYCARSPTLRQLRLRVTWAKAYVSSTLWLKPVLDPIVIRGVLLPTPGSGFRVVLPTSYADADLVVRVRRACAVTVHPGAVKCGLVYG